MGIKDEEVFKCTHKKHVPIGRKLTAADFMACNPKVCKACIVRTRTKVKTKGVDGDENGDDAEFIKRRKEYNDKHPFVKTNLAAHLRQEMATGRL